MPVIHQYHPTNSLHASSSFPGRWILRVHVTNSNGILVEKTDLDVLIDLIKTRQDPDNDEETMELSDNRYLSYSRTLDNVYITVS